MKNTEKGYLIAIFAILLVTLVTAPCSFADDKEARAIMERWMQGMMETTRSLTWK